MRKATTSFAISVCPHIRSQAAALFQLGGSARQDLCEGIILKSVEKIEFRLKSDKNNNQRT